MHTLAALQLPAAIAHIVPSGARCGVHAPATQVLGSEHGSVAAPHCVPSGARCAVHVPAMQTLGMSQGPAAAAHSVPSGASVTVEQTPSVQVPGMWHGSLTAAHTVPFVRAAPLSQHDSEPGAHCVQVPAMQSDMPSEQGAPMEQQACPGRPHDGGAAMSPKLPSTSIDGVVSTDTQLPVLPQV